MSTRVSRQVKIGNKVIGGGAPVLVQSMLNVPSEDYEKNLEQTLALEKAGCEIVRMAVPNLEAVKVLGKLKENIYAEFDTSLGERLFDVLKLKNLKISSAFKNSDNRGSSCGF